MLDLIKSRLTPESTQGDVLNAVRTEFPEYANLPDNELAITVADIDGRLAKLQQFKPDAPMFEPLKTGKAAGAAPTVPPSPTGRQPLGMKQARLDFGIPDSVPDNVVDEVLRADHPDEALRYLPSAVDPVKEGIETLNRPEVKSTLPRPLRAALALYDVAFPQLAVQGASENGERLKRAMAAGVVGLGTTADFVPAAEQFLFHDVGPVGKGFRAFADATAKTADEIMPDNPDFTERFAAGAGSFLGFMAVGGGTSAMLKGATMVPKVGAFVARLAPSIGTGAMTVLEAMGEAGQANREMLADEPNDPDRAARGAASSFIQNIALIGLTNHFSNFLGPAEITTMRKHVMKSGWEGVQEAGQEIIGSTVADKNVDWKKVAEAFGIGTILSGAYGTAEVAIPTNTNVNPETVGADRLAGLSQKLPVLMSTIIGQDVPAHGAVIGEALIAAEAAHDGALKQGMTPEDAQLKAVEIFQRSTKLMQDPKGAPAQETSIKLEKPSDILEAIQKMPPLAPVAPMPGDRAEPGQGSTFRGAVEAMGVQPFQLGKSQFKAAYGEGKPDEEIYATHRQAVKEALLKGEAVPRTVTAEHEGVEQEVGQERLTQRTIEILKKGKVDDRVAVEWVDAIEADPATMEATRQTQLQTGERVAGETVTYEKGGKLEAVIRLAKGVATEKTARHEAFHAVMNLAMTDREKAVILTKFQKLAKAESEKIGRPVSPVEMAADAFGEYRVDGRTSGDANVDGLFGRVKLFLERFSNYLTSKGFQTAHDVFRAIEEGKLPTAESSTWNNDSVQYSVVGPGQSGDISWDMRPDGSVMVQGDADAIRQKISGQGVTALGSRRGDAIMFSGAVGHRVVAALRGDAVGGRGSRAGAVLDHETYTGGEKAGTIKGAPEQFNTKARLKKLHRILTKAAIEGRSGRFWYENSGKAILGLFGGDKALAEKFAKVLAIYSAGTGVAPNMTNTLKAWYQWRSGQPIKAGRFGAQDERAAEVMYANAVWEGEKTNNFYGNLMRVIDPARFAEHQGVTNDMWMMRMFGYPTDAPTEAAYKFVETETNRLAKDLGWEPQQVQAAIWTSIKIRSENAEVKEKTDRQSTRAGDLTFKEDKGGKPIRVFKNRESEIRHRERWFENAVAAPMSEAMIAAQKYDFADSLPIYTAQQSWEARPGRTTGVLPEVNDAPFDIQQDFQRQVEHALSGPGGEDLLAQHMGLPVLGQFEGPGIWQGEVSPGAQTMLALPPRHKPTNENKFQMAPETEGAIEAFAAIKGMLLFQEGMGWHRPFYAASRAQANGTEIVMGRPITTEEAKNFYDALSKQMSDKLSASIDSVAVIPSHDGVRVLNLSFGSDGNLSINNKDLQDTVESAAQETLDEENIAVKFFASAGNLVSNDWKENPHGENYVKRAVDAGFGEAVAFARSVLAPRVRDVHEAFARKFGWTNPANREAVTRARNERVAVQYSVEKKPDIEKELAKLGTLPGNKLKSVIAESVGLSVDEEKKYTERVALRKMLQHQAIMAREVQKNTIQRVADLQRKMAEIVRNVLPEVEQARFLDEIPKVNKTEQVQAFIDKVTSRFEQVMKANGKDKLAQTREDRKAMVERLTELQAVSKDAARFAEEQLQAIKKRATDMISEKLPADVRGRFLVAVRDAKRPNDIARLAERVDKAAEKSAHDVMRQTVIKAYKNIKAARSISADYIREIDGLMSHYLESTPTEETLARLQKLNDLIFWKGQHGEDITIPSYVLKEIWKLQARPLSTMSPAELQDLAQNLKLLAELGRTKFRVRAELDRMRKESDLRDLLNGSVAIQSRDIKVPMRPGEELGSLERLKNLYHRLMDGQEGMRLAVKPMDVIFDILDGVNQYQGPNYRIFKSRIDTSWNDWLNLREKFRAEIVTVAKELKLDNAAFDRIGTFAIDQQESGRQKLINSGLSEQEIESIVLTDAETKFYWHIRARMDELFPRVQKVMEVLYNKPVEKVKNYFPFMTNWDLMEPMDVQDRMERMMVGLKRNVEAGFTESRVGAGKQPVNIDALDVYLRHMDDATYLVTVGEQTKYLGELSRSPQYKSAVGDLGARMVQEWVDVIARKGSAGSASRLAWLDRLRRQLGVAQFSYKLLTAGVQLTALNQGAAIIGTYAYAGAYKMADRNWRKFVIENFPEIRSRYGDDVAFLELSGGEGLTDKVGRIGLMPMQKLDLIAAASVGAGAYMRWADENKHVVDLENPVQAGVEYAQRMVRRSQSSGQFKDAPLALTRGTITGNVSIDKALFQFQSFALNEWSIISHDLWDAGVKGGNPVQAARIAGWLGIAWVTEAAIRYAYKQAFSAMFGPDDDEEQESHLVRDFALDLTRKIPFVGQIMSAFMYERNPVPVFDVGRNLVKGAKSLATGKHDETKLRGAVRLAGALGRGFPFAVIPGFKSIPGTVQIEQIALEMLRDKRKKGH